MIQEELGGGAAGRLASVEVDVDGLKFRVKALEESQHKGFNSPSTESKMKAAQHLTPDKWVSEKDGPFSNLAHDLTTYMNAIWETAGNVMKKTLKNDEQHNIKDLQNEEEDEFADIAEMDRHLIIQYSEQDIER